MRWFPLVLLLVASSVDAEPRSRADARFDEGRKLMDAGKYAEACAAFEDSQQLDPAVTTLLNLAACREKAGQLASAVSVFRAAERSARQDGSPKSTELAQIAAGHVHRLEPRLSTLTIMVPREQRIDGLEIDRNGARIDTVQWSLPQAVDGGRYEIVAKAPGHKPWTTKVSVEKERDAKTIYVPDLVEGTADPGDGTPNPDPDHPEKPARSGGGRSIALPIVLGVAALASGGGAFYFFRRGDEIYADAEVEPDPARQDELWKSANQKRYIAEGLVVTGVACAAVAVWLFVRSGGSDHSSDDDDDDEVALQPSFGDGTATLQVFGRF
jgi:hypothetical protein